MKIVGSVDPEDVPEGEYQTGRSRIWTEIAARAIRDFHANKVTKVVLDDRAELKRMKNATLPYFRKAHLRLDSRIVENPDHTLDVYLQLVSTDIVEAPPPPPVATPTVLGRPRGRPRKVYSAER